MCARYDAMTEKKNDNKPVSRYESREQAFILGFEMLFPGNDNIYELIEAADESFEEFTVSDYAKKTDLDNYVTQAWVEGKMGDYLSYYVTTDDLSTYAKKSELPNTSSFETKSDAEATYAKKTDIPDTSTFAKKTDLPDTTKFVTNEDLNSKGFITSSYATRTFAPNNAITANMNLIAKTYATKDELKQATGGSSSKRAVLGRNSFAMPFVNPDGMYNDYTEVISTDYNMEYNALIYKDENDYYLTFNSINPDTISGFAKSPAVKHQGLSTGSYIDANETIAIKAQYMNSGSDSTGNYWKWNNSLMNNGSNVTDFYVAKKSNDADFCFDGYMIKKEDNEYIFRMYLLLSIPFVGGYVPSIMNGQAIIGRWEFVEQPDSDGNGGTNYNSSNTTHYGSNIARIYGGYGNSYCISNENRNVVSTNGFNSDVVLKTDITSNNFDSGWPTLYLDSVSIQNFQSTGIAGMTDYPNI